ncbi:Ig-like domain-containing protein, partial [Streptococcus pyogenes]
VTTALLEGDFVFVYTPAPGFTGEDSFTYTIREIGGTVTSAPATVSLSVSGAAAVPVNAYSTTLDDDLRAAVATASAAAEPT